MQVISSFLLILLETPTYPLNPLTLLLPSFLTSSLYLFPLLPHLQLAPFFNQTEQKKQKKEQAALISKYIFIPLQPK